ncbi:MAG: hypothetical protein AAGK78_13620, partial [Planctomycetota bacterium]
MAKHLKKDADGFDDVIADSSEVRKLADGFSFIEGPVWIADRLVFSDIPQNRMHVHHNGETGVYREPSQNANGNTLDNDPLNQLRPGGGIYYLNPGYAQGQRAG